MSSPLPIPPLLSHLAGTGRWPSADGTLSLLIPPSRIHAFAPEELELELRPIDPWLPMSASPSPFWNEPFARPDQISHDSAVIIADFGAGSDAVVILDYSKSKAPQVRRLRLDSSEPWSPEKNEWILVADSFDAFAALLGLA